MSKYKNIFSFILSITATQILACNSSHVVGSGGSGAVYTMSADTMQQGDVYVGITAEYTHRKSLSDVTIENAVNNGVGHIHSVDSATMYAFSLSYGLTNNLTLNVLLPYMQTHNIRAGELNAGIAEVHPHEDVKGVGDMSVLLQYKVFDDVKNKIAVVGGIKTPTGKDDVTQAGEVLEIDLQPGTGSWDYYAGLVYTREFENFSFHSNLLYKYVTTGVQNSKVGNILTYNIAFAYKLIDDESDHDILEKIDEGHEHFEHVDYSLDVFLEFNGESDSKNKEDGIPVENTGGNVIFATTGLQLLTTDSYSAFVAVGVPVYQNYNGIQNKNDSKFTIGLGKSF